MARSISRRSRASRVLFEGRGVAANVEVTGEARNEAPVSWSTRSRHSWLVPVSMSRETSFLRTKRNSSGRLSARSAVWCRRLVFLFDQDNALHGNTSGGWEAQGPRPSVLALDEVLQTRKPWGGGRGGRCVDRESARDRRSQGPRQACLSWHCSQPWLSCSVLPHSLATAEQCCGWRSLCQPPASPDVRPGPKDREHGPVISTAHVRTGWHDEALATGST